jgi:hypothetical protein
MDFEPGPAKQLGGSFVAVKPLNELDVKEAKKNLLYLLKVKREQGDEAFRRESSRLWNRDCRRR